MIESGDGRGIRIDVLLTEAELTHGIAEALRSRTVPSQFLAQLELRGNERSRSLLAETATDIADSVGPGLLEVLSLGSHTGGSDLVLLEALRGAGAGVSYAALDAGQAMIELAAARAVRAQIAARGIKADPQDPRHLARSTPDLPYPRLIVLGARVIGAVEPAALARAVRSVMRACDLLLVDVDLEAGDDTGPLIEEQLRGPALALLQSVGIHDAEGALRLERVVRPGYIAYAFQLRVPRGARASVGDETIALSRGETIELGRRATFTPEGFLAMLSDARLPVRWAQWSDDRRSMIALATTG